MTEEFNKLKNIKEKCLDAIIHDLNHIEDPANVLVYASLYNFAEENLKQMSKDKKNENGYKFKEY